MKNKKILLGIITSALLAVIAFLVFDSFSTKSDSIMVVRSGVVDIDLQDLYLSNAKNNPPDNNESSSLRGILENNMHNFKYKVLNTGNKSVRTKHTIILTATTKNDTPLDARYLTLSINNKELIEKTYVLENGEEIKDIPSTGKITAVKYSFFGDIFDGAGIPITEGGSAEKESIDGVIQENEATSEVEKTYSYDFSIAKDADNIYKNAIFNINVVIEAMQYRNTDENNWETVSTVSKSFSSVAVKPITSPNKTVESIFIFLEKYYGG